MIITAAVLDDLLHQIYSGLLGVEPGGLNGSRGDGAEEIGALLELTDPRARLSSTENRGRIFSALGELCWYLSGSEELSHISYYISAYKDESEDCETISGAYGPRLFGMPTKDQQANWLDQIGNVIKKLKSPHSRATKRAVVTLFDRTDIAPRFDHDKGRIEVPCTLSFQFLVRNERLHMIVSMRSNDAYKGLPHDVFAFTMIQEIVARSIGCKLGTYKHFVGSLHLYDDSRNGALQYLNEGWQSTANTMPPMPGGCQIKNVADFLALENAIRTGRPYTEKDMKIGSYWGDLAVLLLAFNSFKAKAPPVEAEKLSSYLKHNVYKKYIEQRVRRARDAESPPRPVTQFSLLNEGQYGED